MALVVNTNMAALRIQTNLTKSTEKMETAMQRMSSGYKINSAKDDAAGYAVSKTLGAAQAAASIGSDNVAMGQDLLSTADGTLSVVSDNLNRIMDLLEQAANGTYSADDITAIQSEITARLAQVNSLFNETFNGIDLFGGSTVYIQTGTGTSTANYIDISAGLGSLGPIASINVTSAASARTQMGILQGNIDDVTERATSIGALQNRLDAAGDALDVQTTNLASAVSTIKDADIAAESAAYVQSQILQSASSTLLVQANSAPQVALTLIKGQ